MRTNPIFQLLKARNVFSQDIMFDPTQTTFSDDDGAPLSAAAGISMDDAIALAWAAAQVRPRLAEPANPLEGSW